MNEGIHLDLDTWIVPGRSSNVWLASRQLCSPQGGREGRGREGTSIQLGSTCSDTFSATLLWASQDVGVHENMLYHALRSEWLFVIIIIYTNNNVIITHGIITTFVHDTITVLEQA